MLRIDCETILHIKIRWTEVVLGYSNENLPSSPARDDVPALFEGVGQAVHVQRGDQDGASPAGDEEEPAVAPFAHALRRTGEVQERKHGQRKLQRQHHLAQVQQVRHVQLVKIICQNDAFPKMDKTRIVNHICGNPGDFNCHTRKR